MVFFILCFAIVNLGLGYGLALYLHGHGDVLPWDRFRRLTTVLKFLPFGNREEQDLETPAPEQAAIMATPAETARVVPAKPPADAVDADGEDSDNDATEAFRSLAAETLAASPRTVPAQACPEDELTARTTSAEKDLAGPTVPISTRPAVAAITAADEAAIASAIELAEPHHIVYGR